jgi:hypothetical protein
MSGFVFCLWFSTFYRLDWIFFYKASKGNSHIHNRHYFFLLRFKFFSGLFFINDINLPPKRLPFNFDLRVPCRQQLLCPGGAHDDGPEEAAAADEHAHAQGRARP